MKLNCSGKGFQVNRYQTRSMAELTNCGVKRQRLSTSELFLKLIYDGRNGRSRDLIMFIVCKCRALQQVMHVMLYYHRGERINSANHGFCQCFASIERIISIQLIKGMSRKTVQRRETPKKSVFFLVEVTLRIL